MPALALGQAAPAQAAGTGYRYWSFWIRQEGGSWSYATEGPATQRPGDGDTLGFRFALSENSRRATKPRGAGAFAAACAKTAPGKGGKRVAVRIDFGTRADAPAGESGAPPAPRTGCARVPENATAADVLAKVAGPLRYDSASLLCAIDHYPAKGCGEQATRADGGDGGQDGRADAEDGKNGKGGQHDARDPGEGEGEGDDGLETGLGVLAGVAAVAILGAAALWQARRRTR
nr:SCO2322 family protein [Streptomyces albus]